MSRLPLLWAALLTAALTVPFLSLSWSFIDTYNVFYQATEPSWSDAVRQAFGASVEYRPLLLLGTKALHQAVGLRMWIYKCLVILQFAAIMGLLVWLFRPLDRVRAIAACVALSCFVGLHTSRALFLFVPLNAYSAGLVLLLASVALALEPRARRVSWIWCPLTLVGLLTLESGVLIVPAAVALWLTGAPGMSARGVVATLAGAAFYGAIRFGLGGGGAPVVYVATGLGFSVSSPERLSEIFERAPWLFWAYNVASSFLTVVASEPRGGVFEFVKSLLDGDTEVWRWLHLGVSLATSAFILAGLLWRSYPRPSHDRTLIAVGVVLLAFGSALGFLYTRDRIAMSAGLGYTLLVYVALVSAFEAAGRRWQVAMLAIATTVIAAGWVVRDGEAVMQIHDTVLEHRIEWTDRYETLRAGRPEIDLMQALRATALSGSPSDPRYDPAWTYKWFERGFRRASDADALHR